jgi:hypothetical protein
MNASASSSSRGGRWRRAVEGGSFMATMSTCIPIRNSPNNDCLSPDYWTSYILYANSGVFDTKVWPS